MHKFGSEKWMEHLLSAAGWQRGDGPIYKLWRRPGTVSYMDTETAIFEQMILPEAIRKAKEQMKP